MGGCSTFQFPKVGLRHKSFMYNDAKTQQSEKTQYPLSTICRINVKKIIGAFCYHMSYMNKTFMKKFHTRCFRPKFWDRAKWPFWEAGERKIVKSF